MQGNLVVPTTPAEEIDCSQVDFTEMEKASIDLATQVNDLVMNVDISNVQFDPYKLLQDAQKIGLYDEDFGEEGFWKASACGS